MTTGTIKFFSGKGYGFIKTEKGDVFAHATGHRQPKLRRHDYPEQPSVCFTDFPIDPNDAEKGAAVVLEVVEGEKGPVAETWWFADAELAVREKIKAGLRCYRIIQRCILAGLPFGDREERCWKVKRILSARVVCVGYLFQLEQWQTHNVGLGQLKTQTLVEDQWVDCPCPMNVFQGGNLFDLPLDWSETVKT